VSVEKNRSTFGMTEAETYMIHISTTHKNTHKEIKGGLTEAAKMLALNKTCSSCNVKGGQEYIDAPGELVAQFPADPKRAESQPTKFHRCVSPNTQTLLDNGRTDGQRRAGGKSK